MAEENSLISSPTCDHDCDCSVHNKHRGKSKPAWRNNNYATDYKQFDNLEY